MKRFSLKQINNGSIAKVHFDVLDRPIKKKDLGYVNIIFAGDGIYLVQKARLGVSYDKLNLPYKNRDLRPYDFDWAWELDIPKAPKEMLEDILACFKYVVNKTKDELLIIIYWDTVKQEHIYDIVKVQLVTGGSVKYAYNEKYEMDERYIKYLEIHSHNTMAAGFSGTDNNDEKKMLCMYGVLGNIYSTSTVQSVSKSFRIWSGIAHRNIEVDEVFDIEIVEHELPSHITGQLDEILRISGLVKDARKPAGGNGSGFMNFTTQARKLNLPTVVDPPESGTAHPDPMQQLINEVFGTDWELSDLDDDELEELGGHAGIDWTVWGDVERDDMIGLIRKEVNAARTIQ